MKAFGVPFYLDKLGGNRKFAVECGWFSVVFQQKKKALLEQSVDFRVG